MGKVKLTLTVEEELIKKARELGLNISKVTENALSDMIRRIEGPNCKEDGGKLSVNAFSERVERARRDLNL